MAVCFLAFWLSGFLAVWLSGCLAVCCLSAYFTTLYFMPGYYLGVWVSGCLGVWVSGCLGVWVSGCLAVSGAPVVHTEPELRRNLDCIKT